MLTHTQDDILQSSAQTVVNPVNCVGVMQAGLAAVFKKRYPRMFADYQMYCRTGVLAPGKLWLWQGDAKQWVLNFPTQDHWQDRARLDYIQAGLEHFVTAYEYLGITRIAFPKLGCGQGRLSWGEVWPLMQPYLVGLNIQIDIHV